MQTLANFASRHPEDWGCQIWQGAWQGAVVGLAALIVVALGRRWRAPVRYWILVLALVKFATPPLTALPTGVFSLVSVSDATVASDGAETSLPEPQSGPELALNPAEIISSIRRKAERTRPSAKIPSGVATTPVRPWWPAVLMSAHLAGAGLILALFVLRGLRLQASWRRMQEPSESLVKSVQAIARELGLRRIPELRISRNEQVPYSMGVLRPVVVLPSRIVEQLPPVELHAVLCHELAHHRRGDLWLNVLQVAIGAVWWFHPVVWFLNRAIRSVREDCCDDLLLSRKFVTDVDYCTTLVHVADTHGRRRPSSLMVAVSMVDGPHPLTGRIRRIMDANLPRRERTGALAVAALLALAAVVLPGVRTVPAQAPKPNDNVTANNDVSDAPRDPQPNGAIAGKSARPMRIRVVDADDRPVAGAKVSLRIGKDESEQKTGSDGTTVLELPPTIADSLQIRVDAEPFVAFATASVWRPDREPADMPPDEFLFRLAAGRVGGGRIVDEQNQPVAGAAVALRIDVEDPRKDRVQPTMTECSKRRRPPTERGRSRGCPRKPPD